MAALAEWKEAGLTDELLVYMTISTGISTSIIQAGEFIRGAGFAGEIGLVPVYAPYEANIWERLEKTASGPAMEQHANQRFETNSMTGETLFHAYYDDDPIAVKLIDDMASSLAQGVYMINSLLDPDKIVFGGSVVTHNPPLIDLLKAKLNYYLIEEQKHILKAMEISELGNEQGMIGAGLSVFDTLHT